MGLESVALSAIGLAAFFDLIYVTAIGLISESGENMPSRREFITGLVIYSVSGAVLGAYITLSNSDVDASLLALPGLKLVDTLLSNNTEELEKYVQTSYAPIKTSMPHCDIQPLY